MASTATQLGSGTLSLDLSMCLPNGMREGKPGLYLNVAPELYHAFDAANNSSLRHLQRSPAHCRYAIDNPKPSTPAIALGNAIHTMILEPGEFRLRYIVAERCSETTDKGGACRNDGKYLVGGKWMCGVHARAGRFAKAFDAMDAELVNDGYSLRHASNSGSRYYASGDSHIRVSDHPPTPRTARWMLRMDCMSIRVDLPPHGMDDPRIVISGDDHDTCRRVRDAVMAHSEARELLSFREAQKEVTGLWKFDSDSGPLLCKFRMDCWIAGPQFDIDLKTTDDASIDAFERSIFDYGYYRQAGKYRHGMRQIGHDVRDHAYIVVEKSPPFGVAVYRLDDELMDAGWDEAERLLQLYARCRANKTWPGYSTEVHRIGVPAWARKRLGL